MDRTVPLSSQTTVRLRTVEPGDSEALALGYQELSARAARAAYERFHTLEPRLSPAMLGYLTEIDHHHHEAIGAEEPATGRGVGVARCIRSRPDPTHAEIAVVVLDDWQGLGVGYALLDALRERARQEAITCLTAEVLSDNDAMLALLQRLGEVELDRTGPETTAHLPI